MMTFDGEIYKGLESISEKFAGLPSITHKVDTADYHPTLNNSIVASITGQISIDGDNAIKFF